MLIPRTKLKRKFNGRYYGFYDSYSAKNDAQKEAGKLRSKGNLVRITLPRDKLLPYYELWIRRRGK